MMKIRNMSINGITYTELCKGKAIKRYDDDHDVDCSIDI